MSAPDDLSPELTAFLRERHLATLSTLRPDGSLHVCAVGFTWDPEHALVRVITSGSSQKARNVAATGRAAVAQVDGRRWVSLEGRARILRTPDEVADAELRYATRYRAPRPNDERVVIAISVARVLGRG